MSEEYADLEPLESEIAVDDSYKMDIENCLPYRSILEQFSTSFIPVTILNKDFAIVMENDGFINLIGKGQPMMFKYFPIVCTAFSDKGEREDVAVNLRDPKKNFSWKGIIEIRHERFLTVRTACSIMPLPQKKSPPDFYFVIFNDITGHSKNLVQSTYLSLLEASKQKDNDTGEHIKRVGNYSGLIAEHLYIHEVYAEINRDFVEEIPFLAQMHDVGKIGTPDDILNKEGPLTDWEWSVMKEHAINGGYILHSYPNPMAQQIAQFHHEKWNGEGYPFQLAGEDIPVAARIVALADVYDAMRTKRSYKNEISHKETVASILKNSGSHFDPEIVKAFRELESAFEKEFDHTTPDRAK